MADWGMSSSFSSSSVLALAREFGVFFFLLVMGKMYAIRNKCKIKRRRTNSARRGAEEDEEEE